MRVLNVWTELALRTASAGWLFTRMAVEAPCGCLVAVRKPSNEAALLLEVPAAAVPADLDLQESLGFKIETESAIPGHAGVARICILLRHEELRDVFALVVEDLLVVLSATRSDRDAVRSLERRLRVWQAFFRSAGGSVLGLEAALGLLGELFVLRDHVIPVLGAIHGVRAWIGAIGGLQDFELPNLAVEVKATASWPPTPFHVSHLSQLDEEALPRLVLVHVQLQVRSVGNSLPEAIADLRVHLDALDPIARLEFDDRLIQVGYIDGHAHRYTNQYTVVSVRFFDVVDDFPRIRPGDVRQGVVDASYSVDLAACDDYELPSLPLTTGNDHG